MLAEIESARSQTDTLEVWKPDDRGFKHSHRHEWHGRPLLMSKANDVIEF